MRTGSDGGDLVKLLRNKLVWWKEEGVCFYTGLSPFNVLTHKRQKQTPRMKTCFLSALIIYMFCVSVLLFVLECHPLL